MDPTLVNGTIVLCDTLNEGDTANAAGAVGTVMQDGGNKDAAFSFPIPATYLSLSDGRHVSQYINKTR